MITIKYAKKIRLNYLFPLFIHNSLLQVVSCSVSLLFQSNVMKTHCSNFLRKLSGGVKVCVMSPEKNKNKIASLKYEVSNIVTAQLSIINYLK